VVAHLRNYIADVWDEVQWDAQFERTQDQLIEAARRAKEGITAGRAEPLDIERNMTDRIQVHA
jgi:predicted N-formylglutamate amidohydrolase